MAVSRGAYLKRGPLFTSKATFIRCVRPDESSSTLRVHYLSDGGATVAFRVRKAEFLVPATLLLKALRETTDREVFASLCGASSGKGEKGVGASLLSESAERMLRAAKRLRIHTQDEALAYLGARFRGVMYLPDVRDGVKRAGRRGFVPSE
jgi:DNA-directed RNA polymerase I subunit RPA2